MEHIANLRNKGQSRRIKEMLAGPKGRTVLRNVVQLSLEVPKAAAMGSSYLAREGFKAGKHRIMRFAGVLPSIESDGKTPTPVDELSFLEHCIAASGPAINNSRLLGVTYGRFWLSAARMADAFAHKSPKPQVELLGDYGFVLQQSGVKEDVISPTLIELSDGVDANSPANIPDPPDF